MRAPVAQGAAWLPWPVGLTSASGGSPVGLEPRPVGAVSGCDACYVTESIRRSGGYWWSARLLPAAMKIYP